MDTPKVCIVTPIHGGWAATSRYLESVGALTYPNVETIVVDDGSTDGSADRVAEEFPDVVVISGDGSLWWAAATNRGVEEAFDRGAEFIFTCNNDVRLDPEALSSSVACALREENALVGSVVHYLDEPERIWFSGASLDRVTGDIRHHTDAPSDPVHPQSTEALTGMGMLIPRRVFEAVGGFDQAAFPQYLADCDFALRAHARGFKLVVTPDSKIYNDVSSAWSVREFERGRLGFLLEMLFSRRSAYWIEGRVKFYRRHWGRGWPFALLRLYRGWLMTYAGPVVKRRLTLGARRGGVG